MILSVDNLHTGYGRIPILNGVTFDVAEQEVVGVLGHNGMGKTTLLRTLIGQLPVKEGRILFRDRDVSRDAPHRRARAGLGYVPQGRMIFPGLTVMDNLRMGYAGRGNDEADMVNWVLEDFPRLETLLDRQGGALSGGEQQILALARCLCGEPKLLLLDEPTEGIQPSIVEEIIDILATLPKKRKLSIIVVEQNLEFIARLSQRVLLIQKGRILREVAPTALTEESLIEEFAAVDA